MQESRTLLLDRLLPKQPGRELGLEPVVLGPAQMARRRSWASAGVRLRCHSARHSPAQRSSADRCVVSSCVYGLKRAVGFRGFQLRRDGFTPGLSGGGSETRPGPNRRPGFVDGHEVTCQRRPRTLSRGRTHALVGSRAAFGSVRLRSKRPGHAFHRGCGLA